MVAHTGTLTGSRLKIGRAKEHLHALNVEIGGLLDRDPYSITVEPDPKTRKQIERFNVLEEPEPHWSLMVGDFAHNLRSALDHAIYAVAVISGASPDKQKTQFPIESNSGRYWTPAKPGGVSIRDRDLHGVDQRFRTIVDRYQPYQRGQMADDDHLSVLCWLNNIDKHRLLHSGFAALETSAAEVHSLDLLSDSTELTVEHRFTGGRMLEDGDELYSFDPRDSKAHMHPEFPIRIAFGERAVTPERMERLTGYVEILIGRLETAI